MHDDLHAKSECKEYPGLAAVRYVYSRRILVIQLYPSVLVVNKIIQTSTNVTSGRYELLVRMRTAEFRHNDSVKTESY